MREGQMAKEKQQTDAQKEQTMLLQPMLEDFKTDEAGTNEERVKLSESV